MTLQGILVFQVKARGTASPQQVTPCAGAASHLNSAKPTVRPMFGQRWFLYWGHITSSFHARVVGWKESHSD